MNSDQKQKTKVSQLVKLSLVSCTLACVSIGLLLICLIVGLDEDIWSWFILAALILFLLGFVLGLGAIISTRISKARVAGVKIAIICTLISGCVLIAAVTFFALVIKPELEVVRCGINMKHIDFALMLYAEENDGRLCVAYGYRGMPYGIRAKISADNGKTWGKEILLRADGTNWDIGYCRMVRRPDGKLVALYYFSTEKNPEQHIAATIWDPKLVGKD